MIKKFQQLVSVVGFEQTTVKSYQPFKRLLL